MKNIRITIQTVLIGLMYIIFKKLYYGPLKITLFIVLSSVVIQQFLYIFNSETSDKSLKITSNIKNEIVKSILVLLLQGILICIIYFLSQELLKKYH
jgi:hypothetical protein